MTSKATKACMSILIAVLILLTAGNAFAGIETTITVKPENIRSGIVTKRIDLKYYQKPTIVFKNVTYTDVDQIPEEAIPRDPKNYDILLGMDRKKPFAVIRIPVYSLTENGEGARRIETISLEAFEKEPEYQNSYTRAAAKTTAANSPLASGTWHKISVPVTGMYKIDYNFVSSQLGATNIPSTSIRLFGHGGKMLPEQNPAKMVEGLTETAISVYDGGDGTFGAGDYIIFYAQGPTNWGYSEADGKLIQEQNYYTDKGYYFLNFDGGTQEKRLAVQSNPPTGNVNVNTFSGVAVHEEDLVNPQRFGKKWWGEELSNAPGKDNTLSVSLDLGAGVTGNAEFEVHVINTAKTVVGFTASLNGQYTDNVSIKATNNDEYAPKALGQKIRFSVPYSGAQATFDIKFNSPSNEGSGYLDYIRANTRRTLSMHSNVLQFADVESVGDGNVATYSISGANPNIQVWDVTDAQSPVRMMGSMQGGNYVFTQDASTLHHFVAFNDFDFSAPEYEGVVPNQNIAGAGPVDYIIVTHPSFKSAAERLANFHRERNGMRVIVATTTQVYNEFSSGGQDASAIRDMARMFYQHAGMYEPDMPKYLLLMGDASYDYKDRVNNNTNFVPTFEAEESFYFLATYSNDDFFGFLDDGEYIERYDIVNALDIGVGRLPVKSLQEADNVVNKIIHYKSPETLGPWRLNILYVADNFDTAGDHLGDAEVMEGTIDESSEIHNSAKVYLDATPRISTPGGQRAPQANKTINDNIFKGTFLINYSGHGNTTVLAHERIITKDDYNKWNNFDRMPFMVTATCDFGQFDQPSFVSSGEDLMLKPDGGVIATLTTTHLVYAYANEILNREFLEAQFQHVNGKWNTFGDAIRIGKNSVYADSKSTSDVIENFRKFALLGDPALEPNFPEHFIETESVVDGATGQPTTTIGALGEYVVNGKVVDVDGNLLDFNGELSVTIFDKARKVKTITDFDATFEVRNNTIYKGKATVNNGKFSFAFIAPKDINYELGNGRISYYAENGITDAAGRDTNYVVGGYSDNPNLEDNPPVIRAYIKDSLFRSGGLTGSNTALFAVIEDETGINVSGNAVGHDLIAILDDDVANPYVMNDFYETAPNTYKRGYVYFPVNDIPEGKHRLTIKAWDVNNNSGVGFIDFEVADGQVVKVQKLMNYPNPFNNITHFVFEHNHPDENLTAEINIYNTAGVFVRKLTQDFISTGSRSNEITWDATDNNGGKLPSGVYIYRLKISTQNDITTTAYQKLVLVR